MKITLDMLKEIYMCSDTLRKFAGSFPNGFTLIEGGNLLIFDFYFYNDMVEILHEIKNHGLNSISCHQSGQTLYFDKNGNLIKETVEGQITEHVYDEFNNLLSTHENGKLISKYTYYPGTKSIKTCTHEDGGSTTFDIYGNISSVMDKYGTIDIIENEDEYPDSSLQWV